MKDLQMWLCVTSKCDYMLLVNGSGNELSFCIKNHFTVGMLSQACNSSIQEMEIWFISQSHTGIACKIQMIQGYKKHHQCKYTK